MDTSYRDATNGAYANALTVLSTVISKPCPGRVVLDAGSKSLSTDMGNAQCKYSENALVSYRPAGDEHGLLEMSNHSGAPQNAAAPAQSIPFEIGDRVELIPSHIDTTVNLHDRYVCHRQGRIEQIVQIAARGKVQ
jgi:D-serine deaminase-like pyridoxal phosphate-dependent protein